MKEQFGVIGTADIAYRRFLPALKLDGGSEYVGIATRKLENANRFAETYGGKVFEGYENLIQVKDITSIYIPLPPALHYTWGMQCLDGNKNVFMEKPCTTKLEDTLRLVDKARKSNLALFENYMFLYHKQLSYMKKMVWEQGVLGDIRLIRINFSFPKRSEKDFRYDKKLGGGALLDCGGYAVRMAMELLGENISVETAKLNFTDGCDVDVYGSATLQDRKGNIAQLAFGMDNGYKCETEIIGQKGWIRMPKVFTAPPDYGTELFANIGNHQITIPVGRDNQFLNAIKMFQELIIDADKREKKYKEMIRTAELIEAIKTRGH